MSREDIKGAGSAAGGLGSTTVVTMGATPGAVSPLPLPPQLPIMFALTPVPDDDVDTAVADCFDAKLELLELANDAEGFSKFVWALKRKFIKILYFLTMSVVSRFKELLCT